MSGAPTARQVEVLRTIDALRTEYGFSPALRDLMVHLGIQSTNGMRDHLRLLRNKGLLSWSPLTARSVRLTAAGRRAIGLSACKCRCHEGASNAVHSI